MKHILIILSFLLLTSLLVSCYKKEETLFRWETSSGWKWKTMGDKNKNPQYKGEVKREGADGITGLSTLASKGSADIIVQDRQKMQPHW